jgi:hypothetical protein
VCETSGAVVKGKSKGVPVRRLFTLFLFISVTSISVVSQVPNHPDWRTVVDEELPLLGQRNWLLVVDSAYPLQSSPGVETVETDSPQIEVLRYVLGALDRSVHLRPEIFLDKELAFVPEDDASGISTYRRELHAVLANYEPESMLHEQLIERVDETGKTMHVLVLKSRMAVPYSSIFIRLNCKYWGDDAEKRMRAKMAKGEAVDR